jgi:hypothetical protein
LFPGEDYLGKQSYIALHRMRYWQSTGYVI